MRVHRYVLPFVLIAVFLGSVLVAKAVGYWSTSGRAAILRDGSGKADPQGIRGWMTLSEVIGTYGIPQEELWARLNLPADLPPETALSKAEALVPGFEVSAVREAVEAYREENPGSAPPASAVTPPAGPSGQSETTPTYGVPLPAEDIKGKNTLAEVAGIYHIPVERLIAEAGLPADVDAKAPLKDIMSKYGIELLNIRDAVAKILAGQ